MLCNGAVNNGQRNIKGRVHFGMYISFHNLFYLCIKFSQLQGDLQYTKLVHYMIILIDSKGTTMLQGFTFILKIGCIVGQCQNLEAR